MHIANVLVTKTWQDLESLLSTATSTTFTFDSDTNYYLTNDGTQKIYLVNKSSPAPTDEAPLGLPLNPGEQAGLKLASGKVYVSTVSGTANLHVESEE